MSREKWVFFRSHESVFSNWFPAPFTLNSVQFTSVEQYMMWRKALLFDDNKTAALILESKDPKEQQSLGRQVQGFDQSTWDKHKEAIVETAVRAKFVQNPKLKRVLVATHGQLAEASPWDKVWGIGLDERDARRIDPSTWPGQNLLGKILVKVRDSFV